MDVTFDETKSFYMSLASGGVFFQSWEVILCPFHIGTVSYYFSWHILYGCLYLVLLILLLTPNLI